MRFKHYSTIRQLQYDGNHHATEIFFAVRQKLLEARTDHVLDNIHGAHILTIYLLQRRLCWRAESRRGLIK
jgi:hypothetical protein